MREGKGCFLSFMNRLPSSLREPEAVSISRPESQNKEDINDFFSKVTLVMNGSSVLIRQT